MKNFITSTFNKKIAEVFHDKTEIKQFLMNHERKHIAISNLVAEIYKLENTALRLDIQRLTGIISDFALMFANAAITQKEQQLTTEAEKYRLMKEHDAQVEMTKELEKVDNESTTVVDEFNS